jgi:hypothetical protein
MMYPSAIEELTLRIRGIRDHTQAPLHISAPWPLIDRMCDEFAMRGEQPELDCDEFGNCEHVRFGPHIAVHVDDALPSDSFVIEIQSRADCDLDGVPR